MLSNLIYDPARGWCDTLSGACVGTGQLGAPSLPTYSTIGALLEQRTGSGWRLFGWTVMRIGLIAPFVRLVGVPWGKAIQGAALSSAAISGLTILRIYRARQNLDHPVSPALPVASGPAIPTPAPVPVNPPTNSPQP